jgi:hypothetical protein
MTISKKQFQIRRSSTRALSKEISPTSTKTLADLGLFPQYSSVEALYNKEKPSLGKQYTRGLPDSKCIDRFENAKHLAEV